MNNHWKWMLALAATVAVVAISVAVIVKEQRRGPRIDIRLGWMVPTPTLIPPFPPLPLPDADVDAPVRPIPVQIVPIHGDADWIENGGYRNKAGEFCCGPRDCKVVPREKVKETPEGYQLETGETIPHSQTQPSEDGQYWVCRWENSPDRIRCFFTPYSGT